MEKIKKERYRKVRGLILYELVKAYPGPLDHYEIRCFLDDLRYTITEEELIFHLAYLEEMGFIRAEKRGESALRRELVFATAKGINARDGRLTDIGIEVENIP
jgi:hypothetical protein